ncbi:uncharacterized protein LOC100572887 [Acyrthosiphon pisum]|uniref:Uncharacterized protein n=1 Tax=Acyrthosiphon pisum TaxID=7029 RepID=A0A8R2A8I2_ACYPI|nr:uncharacterized protein LOC100572887 [Acyrthosiphon pisum]|eukprot:XP_003242026.1 PREDICTED: uncharacterized protein LOC100572887 [Acyrthosiphon pisum]
MTTTMMGHGGSFDISGQSLSLVLLLLLLPLRGIGGGGVLGLEEESGQIMDDLPDEHRDKLELLTTVLAMDKEWSAVRSEKLKSELADDAGLVKEFCLTLPDFGKEPIDAIDISKKIMIHCPHSGMYVDFAVKSLALSAQCLFNRHARLQLAVIISLPFEAIEQFASHLKRLVGDYQLFANLLTSIGVDLHPLIALVRYFSEVARQWVTYTERKKEEEKYKNRIKREANELEDLMDEYEGYCAVSPTIWNDQNQKYTVSLDMNNIEPMFNDPELDDPSMSTLPKNEIPKEPIVRKAHKLQWILLKEFKKLLLGKLPPEVWKLIFENNILVRQIESKQKTGILAKAGRSMKNLFKKSK